MYSFKKKDTKVEPDDIDEFGDSRVSLIMNVMMSLIKLS